MSESLTPKAHLRVPAYKQRAYNVALDSNRARLDGMVAIGDLCVSPVENPSASLNVQVSSGRFKLANGTTVLYAGTASFALPDNANTYLWLDSGGVLNSGTALPTAAAHVPLAAVSTSAGVVTSIVDRRPVYSTVLDATGGAPVGSQYVVLAADGTLTGERVLAVTAPLSKTDAGAGNNVTIALTNTGANRVPLGDGTAVGNYQLVAGSNVTLTRDDTGKTLTIAASGGGGGVSSVGLSAPAGVFSVSGSPVTSSGTLALSLATQAAREVLIAPGGGGVPAFRGLVMADLPPIDATGLTGTVPVASGGTGQSSFADGDILVGVTSGATLRKGRLVAGGATTITFDNTTGDFTIDISPTAGSGTVTSVNLAAPGWLSVSGGPVTGSGTLTLAAPAQAANKVLAAPPSSAGTPDFRLLVADDVPHLPAAIITSGTLVPARGGTGLSTAAYSDADILVGDTASGNLRKGSLIGAGGIAVSYDNATGVFTISGAGGGGSVTSVGLTMPGIFTVTGSPVTSSGTLAVGLATQSANKVLAGPASGSSPAAPAFRGLVEADLPPIPASLLSGLNGTANQVTVAAGAGTITLSLPQSIHAGARPTFAGLTLSGTPSSPPAGTLRYDGTAKAEVLNQEGIDSRRVGLVLAVLSYVSVTSSTWTDWSSATRVGSSSMPAALATAGRVIRLTATGSYNVPSVGYLAAYGSLGIRFGPAAPSVTVDMPTTLIGTSYKWFLEAQIRITSSTAAVVALRLTCGGVAPQVAVGGQVYDGSVAWPIELQAKVSTVVPSLSVVVDGGTLEVLG